MLQSELEDHVNNWPQQEVRIYKYRMGLNVPHIVALIRENDLYTCVQQYSTYKKYPELKAENLMKEISSTRLIYVEKWSWGFDPTKLRVNNCTCGALFTSEPNLHLSWCNK